HRLPLAADPFPTANGFAEIAPELLLDRRQRHEAAVRRAIDLVAGGTAVEEIGGERRLEAGPQCRGQRVALPGEHGLGEAEVEIGAPARPAAADEGTADGQRRLQAAG